MKHIPLILTLFLTCVLYGCADGTSSKETAGAEAVIRRTFGTFPEALELRLVAKTGDCDSYTYESTRLRHRLLDRKPARPSGQPSYSPTDGNRLTVRPPPLRQRLHFRLHLSPLDLGTVGT